MRCLAVCQDELVIRMLSEVLLPSFEVEFIVENRPLARRLHDDGIAVASGDPRRTETWVKADLGPDLFACRAGMVMAMPKMKTHKGSRKRFRITASGKLKRRQAGKKHLNSPKAAKRKRQLRGRVAEVGRVAQKYVVAMGGA